MFIQYPLLRDILACGNRVVTVNIFRNYNVKQIRHFYCTYTILRYSIWDTTFQRHTLYRTSATFVRCAYRSRLYIHRKSVSKVEWAPLEKPTLSGLCTIWCACECVLVVCVCVISGKVPRDLGRRRRVDVVMSSHRTHVIRATNRPNGVQNCFAQIRASLLCRPKMRPTLIWACVLGGSLGFLGV